MGENFVTGLYNLEISSSQLLPTKTSLPHGPGTQTSVPLFTHHTASAPTCVLGTVLKGSSQDKGYVPLHEI